MVWSEEEAKRGSVEVCSAIYEWLLRIKVENYKTITTFSDSCGGQNRNKAIIAFFMYICQMFQIESWEHQYLETGHSYLPNDRDFGQIAKNAKYASTVYTFDQWTDVIKSARKKNPFEIIRMKGKFREIEKLVESRKFNNENTSATVKFNFIKLRYFKVFKNSNKVEYRELDDQIHTLDYPFKSAQEMTSLQYADRAHKISKEKYKDLMSMMHLIPDEYKPFYTNLPHE